MRRFSQAFLFVLLAAGSLTLPAAMKRFTHSFHAARLFAELPDNESWNIPSRISLENVRQILSQDYYYVGRGSQAFVFVSGDRSAVLKLFIFDSTGSLFKRFRGVPNDDPAQKRAIQTLEACRLAYQFLPEETALLYVHLRPGSENLPTVHLTGPAWKQLDIQPDLFRFVLQKRADLLNQCLMQAYLHQDRIHFFDLIDRLNALLDRRTSCGIVNTDPTLFENFGVVDAQPVEIDFGNYIYCPEMVVHNRSHEEKARYTGQLLKWVERYIPQWKNDVALRIGENR